MEQQVIILGAGKSKQFLENPAIISVDASRRTLDWLLCAFNKEQTQYTFVGGYKLDEITEQYPYLHFVVNPNWQHSSCDESLRLSDFHTHIPAFVCYGDILIRTQLIHDMQQAANEESVDVVVAVDSSKTLLESKPDYETVEGVLNANGLLEQLAFIGCIYIKPRVLRELKADFPKRLNEHRLSGVVSYLQQKQFRIKFVDAHGLWSEVLKPADVARFVLTTKAKTLYTLRRRIKTAHIAEQVHFSVGAWKQNHHAILLKVLKTFAGKTLVVRSSSLQEDGFTKANAGKFDSLLNVQPNEQDLFRAIEAVIASYGTLNENDQVLVQPMLNDVKVSGVIFTRTLNYGAPYYVVNYDEKDTAAITSGSSTDDQIFYHWKHAPIPADAPEFFPQLYTAIQEIEQLTQFDALDIEFAVTNSGELYIFQVRPLASQRLREISDTTLQKQLNEAIKRFEDWQTPHPFIEGEHTIFGVMPDWNPAEIVGTKPRTLAISLYQQLITNSVWAQQRAEFGYKDVRPYPLIVCFAGHPYVDVRASIHSFLPVTLRQETTRKLVHYYLKRLEKHPEWHDKLEFMVMPTCYTFDFNDRWRAPLLQEAGLSEQEFEVYRKALFDLTLNAFEKCKACHNEMKVLNQRFERILDSKLADYDKIFVLFETCKQGTLNFSHLARCGFIASSFLKSLVSQKILSEVERDMLVNAIHTITGEFFEETQNVIAGKSSRENCIRKYGHLRPGTYDITSPSYRSNPDKYMFSKAMTSEKARAYLQKLENPHFETALRNTLQVSLESFTTFLRQAIAGREYSKFVFTRYISTILDLIEKIANSYGFSADDFSHLPIAQFLDVRNGITNASDLKRICQNQIEAGKEFHRIVQCIELPSLITKKSDFFSFFVPKTIPNFIGNQCVEAELTYLKNSKDVDVTTLHGRIVLIEKADPGFDWIFNYGIRGLITVYGGPNSHMAIRSAELQLPASIGVGNTLFEKLKNAQLIQLDCRGHRINIIH